MTTPFAPDRRSTAAALPVLAARLCDIDLQLDELGRLGPTSAIIAAHVTELTAERQRLALVLDEADRLRRTPSSEAA